MAIGCLWSPRCSCGLSYKEARVRIPAAGANFLFTTLGQCRHDTIHHPQKSHVSAQGVEMIKGLAGGDTGDNEDLLDNTE
ncbi:hypothetical protein J6590_063333 [Homalodisca vitripennis]|nr:hypothetical protein J6590_063333 [Homalodisca vitripennis]